MVRSTARRSRWVLSYFIFWPSKIRATDLKLGSVLDFPCLLSYQCTSQFLKANVGARGIVSFATNYQGHWHCKGLVV